MASPPIVSLNTDHGLGVRLRMVRMHYIALKVLSVCGLTLALMCTDFSRLAGILCANSLVQGCASHLAMRALAEDKESEAEKRAEEEQRESAEQESEWQEEQQKQELERQYEQDDKELEGSGASEEELKRGEKGYKQVKRKLWRGYRHKDDRVPKTLVGLVRHWFSQPRKEPRHSAKKEEGKEKEEEEREEKKAASPKNKQKPAAKSRPYNIPKHTSVIGGEVLAVNLSNKGAARARRLGFTVKSKADLSRSGATVTRLQVPPGMGLGHARRLLQQELPSNAVALNHVYRIYHAANSHAASKNGAAGGPDAAKSPGGTRHAGSAQTACAADHCFARSVIGWRRALSSCSAGMRIGVIDTAIDHGHPTFKGRTIYSGEFVTSGRVAAPRDHGTSVLSLLAGAPSSGTPGLIPDAHFYTANIFSADPDGEPVTDSVTLLRALDWLAAWGVRIVNMSFTGPRDELVYKTIQGMAAKGVIFVAAAGNDGPGSRPSYPAAYPEVIAVTAVNKNLRGYRRASRGAYIDVAAPGVDVWTALPGEREGYQSGTSYAVTYVVALMTTIAANHSQNGTAKDLIGFLPLRDLGPRGQDPIYGRGLALAPKNCNTPWQAVPRVANASPTPVPGSTPPDFGKQNELVWHSPSPADLLSLMGTE